MSIATEVLIEQDKKERERIYKAIWNEAIEAALKVIENDMTDAYKNVRKLKK